MTALSVAPHDENTRAQKNKWQREHPEHMRENSKKWRLSNPEKFRAYQRQWRTDNPEKVSAYHRRWRQAHLDKARARSREWDAVHPEQASARVLQWYREHPEQSRAHDQKRRARKLHAAINDFTAAQWREMLNAYGHCCVYCGRKMQRLTQDHITPLSRGGNHTKSNIVPACRSCNSKKGTGEPLVPVQPMLL